jgi:hypothetical protein
VQKNLMGMVVGFAAALLAAGCSHSQPAPEPAPVQQAPVQASPAPAPTPAPAPAPAPAPVPAAPPAYVYNGPQPKGATLGGTQAAGIAQQFAWNNGLPGAQVIAADFKNGAWVVDLHGPVSNGTYSKMSAVVGNDGRVRSHVLVPYGQPVWNQMR